MGDRYYGSTSDKPLMYLRYLGLSHFFKEQLYFKQSSLEPTKNIEGGRGDLSPFSSIKKTPANSWKTFQCPWNRKGQDLEESNLKTFSNFERSKIGGSIL